MYTLTTIDIVQLLSWIQSEAKGWLGEDKLRSSVVAQLFNANDNNAVNGLLWWQWNAVVGGVFNIMISTLRVT